MGGDLSLAGVSRRCVARHGSDLEVGWLSEATSVGPSRGPPRTGVWAYGAPRRKRRGPGPTPVPGHDGDDGGGEAELRELGSPSRGSPGRCVVYLWEAVRARMGLRDAGRRLGGPSRVGMALEYPQRFLGRLRRHGRALRGCCGVAGSALC